MRYFVKHSALLVSLVFACILFYGLGGAAIGGSDSLAGRAIVLLVSETWTKSLGEKAVYYGLYIIQLILAASLLLGPLFVYFKVNRKYITICIGVFLIFSVLVDIARIGYTAEYALLMIVKYIVVIGTIYYIVKPRSSLISSKV